MTDDTQKPDAPREFWVTPQGSHISYLDPDEKAIHVIEHSAYAQKCEELAKAQQLTELFAKSELDLKDKLEAAQKEIERLQQISHVTDESSYRAKAKQWQHELEAERAKVAELKAQGVRDSLTGGQLMAEIDQLKSKNAEMAVEKLGLLQLIDGQDVQLAKARARIEELEQRLKDLCDKCDRFADDRNFNHLPPLGWNEVRATVGFARQALEKSGGK